MSGGVSGGGVSIIWETGYDKHSSSFLLEDTLIDPTLTRRSKSTAFSGAVEHNAQPSGGIYSTNGQIIMSDDFIM